MADQEIAVVLMIGENHRKIYDSRTLLAFVHIRKCAGTTLLSILRSNFFLTHLDIKPATKRHKRFLDDQDLGFALRINPFISSIAGHKVSPAARLETLVPNIRYITTFRDPRARYLSDYIYHVEVEKRPVTFEHWLTIEQFKNCQTKAITGTSNVDNAIDAIEKQLWLVGICEAYDEFLLMLKKKLAIPGFDIRYKSRRVASDRKATDRARQIEWDKYHDAIYENNRSDYELYNYVRQIVLPRQRSGYGAELERDLAEFKKELRGYRPNRLKEFVCCLYRNLYYGPLWKLPVRFDA